MFGRFVSGLEEFSGKSKCGATITIAAGSTGFTGFTVVAAVAVCAAVAVRAAIAVVFCFPVSSTSVASPASSHNSVGVVSLNMV